MEIDCFVELKITFIVNVSEGKRLCPMEARLNPEWKCKEWDEPRSETYPFFGFDRSNTNPSELVTHIIPLDVAKGECITSIKGVYCTFISKVEFTTNFGRKYTIGHDYPKQADPGPQIELFLSNQEEDEVKTFEVEIPYGSKAVCLNGSYNANLLALSAYYD